MELASAFLLKIQVLSILLIGVDSIISSVWTNTKGTTIEGRISAAHGNSGAIRAIFERGLPGQALGTEALIE